MTVEPLLQFCTLAITIRQDHSYWWLNMMKKMSLNYILWRCWAYLGKSDSKLPHEETSRLAISIYALSGCLTTTTFCLIGVIKSDQIQILLDGGVPTHLLPIQDAPTFTIAIRNGIHLKNEGWFEHVPVTLQHYTCTPKLFTLAIQGANVILGTT